MQRSSPQWTNAEKAEFTKALLSRGVPFNTKTNEYDWELFRARLGGTRSGDELCSYYNAFLAFCRELVIKHSAATADAKIDSANRDGVSFDTAKSIVLRLMFFFALRSAVLPHPYLEYLLRTAPRPGPNFPAWWTPDHDRALLTGVEVHGLDDMEAICNDPQLPFRSQASKLTAGQKTSEAIGFPSKPDVLKRVEALCKYVQVSSSSAQVTTPLGAPSSAPQAAPQQQQKSTSPSTSRAPSQTSPSALMPPPISPARKEKRTPPAERRSSANPDEAKHQRTDD